MKTARQEEKQRNIRFFRLNDLFIEYNNYKEEFNIEKGIFDFLEYKIKVNSCCHLWIRPFEIKEGIISSFQFREIKEVGYLYPAIDYKNEGKYFNEEFSVNISEAYMWFEDINTGKQCAFWFDSGVNGIYNEDRLPITEEVL